MFKDGARNIAWRGLIEQYFAWRELDRKIFKIEGSIWIYFRGLSAKFQHRWGGGGDGPGWHPLAPSLVMFKSLTRKSKLE
jgi:hypothetical protein